MIIFPGVPIFMSSSRLLIYLSCLGFSVFNGGKVVEVYFHLLFDYNCARTAERERLDSAASPETPLPHHSQYKNRDWALGSLSLRFLDTRL
mgnify:CR=1 FL=1